MIELYAHNKTAYDEVRRMLAATGKAAVIHPTGTGKSFIAFRLCEARPEAQVCWLSPSEHIWHTQLEQIRARDGWRPWDFGADKRQSRTRRTERRENACTESGRRAG